MTPEAEDRNRNQFCPIGALQRANATSEVGLYLWEHSNISLQWENQPAELNDSSLGLPFYIHYLLISCVFKTEKGPISLKTKIKDV